MQNTTPIEDLKDGLLNKHWGSISAAYKKLTGETISVSQESDDTFLSAILDISEICKEHLGNLKPTEAPNEQENKSVGSEESMKVEVVKQPKKRTPRPPPRVFKLTCSQCEKEYNSPTNRNDVGGKCPKCLKDLINSRSR